MKQNTILNKLLSFWFTKMQKKKYNHTYSQWNKTKLG